jgi:hypothetical protein
VRFNAVVLVLSIETAPRFKLAVPQFIPIGLPVDPLVNVAMFVFEAAAP